MTINKKSEEKMNWDLNFQIECVDGCVALGEKIDIKSKDQLAAFSKWSLASDDYYFTYAQLFDPSMKHLKAGKLQKKYKALMAAQAKMYDCGLFDNKYQVRGSWKLNSI
jgi:hypothetical protein